MLPLYFSTVKMLGHTRAQKTPMKAETVASAKNSNNNEHEKKREKREKDEDNRLYV
jgi:hypothetical protein